MNDVITLEQFSYLKLRTFITFLKQYFQIPITHYLSLILTVSNMFPLLFRVGPVVLVQLLFMIAGGAQLIIRNFLPCYGYTFIELALQLFLVQMIVVFRLINRNKQLRLKYISKVVFGTEQYYKRRILWNTFCFGSVVIGLAYWMVRQGLNVTNSKTPDSQKIFTLYPLCFFSDDSGHPESSSQLSLVLNFLYSCNVLMNMLIIALNIRSYYAYTYKIKRNRIFFAKNAIQKSESLIDCEIINQSISRALASSDNSEEMDCGICLRKFCGEKVIRLSCSHYFHGECIIDWLERKDQCPYRCV